MRGQEREKYETAAKGIKGYRSERELRVLPYVALGGNNRKKWSDGQKSQRSLKLKMQTESERYRKAHVLFVQ